MSQRVEDTGRADTKHFVARNQKIPVFRNPVLDVVIKCNPVAGPPSCDVIEDLNAPREIFKARATHPRVKGCAYDTLAQKWTESFRRAAESLVSHPRRRQHNFYLGKLREHFLKQRNVLEQLISGCIDIHAAPRVPPNIFMVEHSIEIEIQNNLVRSSN